MGAILEEGYEQKKQILLKDIWYFYLLAMLNCWSRIVCKLCYFAPYVWWLSLSKLQWHFYILLTIIVLFSLPNLYIFQYIYYTRDDAYLMKHVIDILVYLYTILDNVFDNDSIYIYIYIVYISALPRIFSRDGEIH